MKRKGIILYIGVFILVSITFVSAVPQLIFPSGLDEQIIPDKLNISEFNKSQEYSPVIKSDVHTSGENGYTQFSNQNMNKKARNYAGEPILRTFVLPNPLYRPGTAWNQKATEAAVNPDSEEIIQTTYRVLLGDTTGLVNTGMSTPWPVIALAFDNWSIPIFRAGDGWTDVLLMDYMGNLRWGNPTMPARQEGGPIQIRIPAGEVRPAGPQDPGADGHMVMCDPASLVEFDFWQATTQINEDNESLGGGYNSTQVIRAGTVAEFSMVGGGSQPVSGRGSSARATGVALLGGLIVSEDIDKREINHALVYSIPGPRNLAKNPEETLESDILYPASTTEALAFSRNSHAIRAGERIRLKNNLINWHGEPVDESTLIPVTRMLLAALREYGAYCVDNGGGFGFYAEDYHTA